MPVIGIGGFGKVYKYTLASGNTLALKDEIKVYLFSSNLYIRMYNCALVVFIQLVSNNQW